MFDFLKNNPLVAEARTARFRPKSMTMHLIIFFLVLLVTDFVASLPSSIYLVFRTVMLMDPALLTSADPESSEALIEAFNAATLAATSEDGYILTMLFSTVATGVLCVLYCRFVERRPISSMGLFINRRVPFFYVIGLGAGLLLFGLTFLICYISDAVSVAGGSFAPVMLVLYFFAFLIQGASEEILVRGYFMTSLTNNTGAGSAIVCSSLLFAAMHSGNTGTSLYALLNVFLFGLLLGLIVFRTGSLFLSMALHGIWNFAEGNVFGMAVSGLRPSHTVLLTTLADGRATTNGGDFGPEGGAAATIALVIAIAIFLLLPQKTAKTDAEQAEHTPQGES